MNKLDKANYLKRVIIVSWIALALCFVIKIFGGNLFEIACANENFIAVCDYADNHLWAEYLISAVYCLISLYFYCLAIMQEVKYKPWQLAMLIATVLVGTAIKMSSIVGGWIFDIWQMFIMPLILLGKRYRAYYRMPVGVALLLVFQLVSMVTKNIDISVITQNGVLISAIFSIDVIIMTILYFAHSIQIKTKKEQK